ncbi:hypothetical protein N9W17_05365 [Jannaschia sp.]|nr:hypothetical protein [Jannaschia sp.]
MRGLLFASLCALIAAPAAAQDFSEGSEAKSWNLYAEVPARFTATVSDPLCELAGQCSETCGDGQRQLVLMREADGVMVFPLKNGQPAFTGAAVELAPFCNQRVEVDGLMIDDAEIGAQNVYLIQRLREPDGEWMRANQWTKVWAEQNPDAAGRGPWFRRDPRVRSEIETNGWLGLGLEVDEAFLKDWF